MEANLQLFKSNPTKLNLLPTILDQLLSNSESEQTKLEVTSNLIATLHPMIRKLDPLKQKITFEFITNHLVKLCECFICLLEGGEVANMDGFWSNLQKLVCCAEGQGQSSNKIAGLLAAVIFKTKKIDYGSLKEGHLIYTLLSYLADKITQNSQQILHFLLNLPHKNQIVQYSIEVQQKYQEVLIGCLEHIEKLDIVDQAQIYNKLGDKVFSKLASPLTLSEFLLHHLASEDQHPMIQVEVLSALFILVGKYGLELEKFYKKLEHMIAMPRPRNQSLFRLKNSKRFLKLIEAAMRSSKVPFKNISTLCSLLLQAIPRERSELVFWLLSFLVNLVKKHRQLQNHLNQFPEIEALKYHYSSKVRSLIKELSKNLNKSEYLDIEDFSGINCQKLSNQKLEQIVEKMNSCQEAMEFKVPKIIDYL